MGNIQRQKARVVGEDSVLEQESCYEINENSTGFGRVGTVGKVVRLRKQSFRYALSPTLAVIKPIRPCFSSLCFLLLKSPGFQSKVVSNMTGSTRPAIGIQILRRIPTLLPPASSGKIYEYFEDRVGALIKKGDVLNAANLSLIEARDALLPKLISGEIRIPDAEKMLEEVGV
jgi:type I restriction enzyme S subunit